MSTKRIKLIGDVDLLVDATVSIYTGKPLVVLAQECGDYEDITMRPIEAERLAIALTAAAAEARKKA